MEGNVLSLSLSPAAFVPAMRDTSKAAGQKDDKSSAFLCRTSAQLSFFPQPECGAMEKAKDQCLFSPFLLQYSRG